MQRDDVIEAWRIFQSWQNAKTMSMQILETYFLHFMYFDSLFSNWWIEVWLRKMGGVWLGTGSKPNRRLTGSSVRFRPVSIVLNNDNRAEPAVEFWSHPLLNMSYS